MRIKDRLELGTRDININILFMKKILCEIQLAVTDQVEEKQKNFDAFNHYLYELKRSNLGPIMESSCIWTHLDQRSKQFKKLNTSKDQLARTLGFRKHPCPKKDMQAYKYAFVCSLCGRFFSSPIGIIENRKCGSCLKYYECSHCIEGQMSERDLKMYLGLL